eukprot:scaffold22784_cov127-Cylindrotheca_fusiformis.AAC.1
MNDCRIVPGKCWIQQAMARNSAREHTTARLVPREFLAYLRTSLPSVSNRSLKAPEKTLGIRNQTMLGGYSSRDRSSNDFITHKSSIPSTRNQTMPGGYFSRDNKV